MRHNLLSFAVPDSAVLANRGANMLQTQPANGTSAKSEYAGSSKPAKDMGGLLSVFFALIAAIVCLAGSWEIGTRVTKTMPFFFDPVAYQFNAAQVYDKIGKLGLWQAVGFEAAFNQASLRNAITAIIYPPALAHPLGEMLLAWPALALFACLLSYATYRYSRSVCLAVSAALVLIALPGLYHPRLGLHEYWHDLAAAMLLGSGMVSLLLYRSTHRARWLGMFAFCTSMAANYRYISFIYAVVALYPVLLLEVVAAARASSKHIPTMLKHSAAVLIPTLFLAGPHLLGHLQPTLRYYNVLCYSRHGNVAQCATALPSFLVNELLLWPVLLLCIAFAIFNVVVALRRKRKVILDVTARYLPLIALSAFIILICRPMENGYLMWYPVSFLYAGCLIPYTAPSRSTARVFAAILATLAVSLGTILYLAHHRNAVHPELSMQHRKQMDTQIAKYLMAQTCPKPCLQTFFAEYATAPMMEAFYATRKLSYQPDRVLFSHHAAYFKADYPGKSDAEILAKITNSLDESVTLAVAFEDPGTANDIRTYWLSNALSRQVSFSISNHLQQSGTWKRIGTVDGYRFGKLAVYENEKLVHAL